MRTRKTDIIGRQRRWLTLSISFLDMDFFCFTTVIAIIDRVEYTFFGCVVMSRSCGPFVLGIVCAKMYYLSEWEGLQAVLDCCFCCCCRCVKRVCNKVEENGRFFFAATETEWRVNWGLLSNFLCRCSIERRDEIVESLQNLMNWKHHFIDTISSLHEMRGDEESTRSAASAEFSHWNFTLLVGETGKQWTREEKNVSNKSPSIKLFFAN